MSLRLYLWIMSLGTFFCWVAWFFVIIKLAPEEAGFMGLMFFYMSLFLAIVGTFSVLGFLLRLLRLKNDQLVFRHVRHTFRQSILIGVFLISLLMLKANEAITWWIVTLLLLLLFLIEAILSTRRKFNNVDYV